MEMRIFLCGLFIIDNIIFISIIYFALADVTGGFMFIKVHKLLRIWRISVID